MNSAVHEFIAIDVPPMLAGTLACLACSVVGNFLVLRRMSLMGDAISHSVLPGLVVAFMLTGTRDPLAMFLGAAAAGLVTVGLVEALRRYARIEPGAAMGVVFSVLFALGVLLLERGAGRQVDLDADCVLNGVLEGMIWFPPTEWGQFWTWETLRGLPRQVWTLIGVTIVVCGFVAVCFKELRIVCFDPGLATSQGYPAGPLNGLFMVLVACVTVASFEAVGSILVIAMLICPAAAARMLTDRLWSQVVVSGVIAAVCGIGGYAMGAFGPRLLGFSGSLSASGMMTVAAGGAMTVAMIFAPRHGVAAKAWRRIRLSMTIAREDLLGSLYRAEERGEPDLAVSGIDKGMTSAMAARFAKRQAVQSGQIVVGGGRVSLTEAGRREAASVIRAHRLWEAYLVERGGFSPDHVHDPAMRLEHARDAQKRERLLPPEPARAVDPHDRPIPPQRSE